MVGHEAVGMPTEPVTPGQLLPQDQIELVILGLDETGLAVVAALDDVVGQTCEIHPGATGHKAFAVRVTGRRYGTKGIDN